MISSMTGYGRSDCILHGRNIAVEIRSVNSRYFEYTSKMPRSCAFMDDKLKRLLNGSISRGKVELGLTIQALEASDTVVEVNTVLAKQYYNAMQELSKVLQMPSTIKLQEIAHFPDVLCTKRAPLNEDELWEDISTVCKAALEQFCNMRKAEGQRLKDDILSRLNGIEQIVAEIELKNEDRVKAYTAKLHQRLQELLNDCNIDESRLLTEAAIFADKTAVDEETVRLKSHIEQYREILELSEPVGRKLDFLTQELNRETNTIGSKAQDLEITRKVVQIKAEIEKIREQIQNIE